MSSPAHSIGGSDADEQEISDADVFEILSNRRRRFALHAIKRREEPIELSELSEQIAAWEMDTEPEQISYEDRRGVYVTLKTTHLPMMDEQGVIEFEQQTKTVESTELLSELDVYIETLREDEIPWSTYYIGLAVICFSIVIAVGADAPGAAALDPLDVGVITVVAFGVSSLIHHLVDRRNRLGNTEKPPELRR
jgi:predicted transcriptional regulator